MSQLFKSEDREWLRKDVERFAPKRSSRSLPKTAEERLARELAPWQLRECANRILRLKNPQSSTTTVFFDVFWICLVCFSVNYSTRTFMLFYLQKEKQLLTHDNLKLQASIINNNIEIMSLP